MGMIEDRDGFIIFKGGRFAPGELWVSTPWSDDDANLRRSVVAMAGDKPVATFGPYESADKRARMAAILNEWITDAATRALVYRARQKGLPVAALMLPAVWRDPYPGPEDVLRLFRLGGEYRGVVLGGRYPVVLAIPQGYEVDYLSARETRDACQAGLPVIEDSAHGAWKVVKHQGALVRSPDGRYWRPGWTPAWRWYSRRRRWQPEDHDRRILACGDRAEAPEGVLEEGRDG